jgi:glycine cleavage system transcriptional repressor
VKKVVVIHSIGKDRPGIVADVTRIVTDKGGNVGESRAQLLGGHFSLMMLVEIAEKEVKTLEEQLGSGVAGMKTECFEADDQKNATVAPTIAFAGRFKLSGADNPGIVHKLTSVLAHHCLTIGNMKTEHESCPFGGTELFTMEGRALGYEPLASGFEMGKVRDELMELGESLNCDIEFDDITGHSIRH